MPSSLADYDRWAAVLWVSSACGWVGVTTTSADPALVGGAWCGMPSVFAIASGAAWVVADPASLLLQLFAMAAGMIAATMSPTLRGPLFHLWNRSLARHRWRAIALFVVAYGCVWLISYCALVLVIEISGVLLRNAVIVGPLMLALTLLWHVSAAREVCLRRCHTRPRLSIFGLSSWTDPLSFGFKHACWCVATCIPLMALPLCFPTWHLPLMAIAMAVIVAEREGGITLYNSSRRDKRAACRRGVT